MTPLCIYHGFCMDGFTAAWTVLKAFAAADFYPGVYGEDPPDVIGRDVIMVDFSYKRAVLDALAQRANSILILDHHKTAAEDLRGFQVPPAATVWKHTAHNEIAAWFDMSRSGAQLAWDYLHGTSRPLLVDYVGDRDLWKFELPLSREVNAFVSAHEFTFENWDHLDRQLRDHMDVQRVADMGGAIDRKHRKDINDLLKVTKREMMIGGHIVPAANLPGTMASDAGNIMAQGEKFSATYYDGSGGRKFSLRSTDEGLDVSVIAQRYGGGGHRNAAGFEMPIGWEGDP